MSTSGVKIEDMRESGRIIRCMELVSLSGLMVENMKVSMLMTKNMELEHSIGPMDVNIMDLGKMVSSMGEESIT